MTADAIGRNMGVAPDSEFRYRAGIIHVLGEAAEEGHCFLPHTELVERVTQRLSLPDHQPNPPVVADLLFQMGMEEQIVLQGHRDYQYVCYQPSFFHSEQKLAERLNQLLSRPVQVDTARVSNWIGKFTAATGMQLSPQQREAVEKAASERVLILA